MTITKQHIERLYKFTRQHYVEYYDLQTELVDHMANDIETIWEASPHLSFEEARDKAFKKFGVFGFMEVVEAREKAMNKKYFKLLLSYAKDWFRLPQILLTIGLLLGFYTLLRTAFGSVILGVMLFVITVYSIVMGIKFSLKRKRQKREGRKLWLLEQVILTNALTMPALLFPQVYNFFNVFEAEHFSRLMAFVFALFYVLTIIYVYISTVVIPKNAHIHLKETYPEYSM
ncbi:hypothetical protein IA57_05150 [Mangrovimonas yunxiaonensis]|uniref:Uncharacterized protein n=1 Tax=Mangrovimonas yunxiaonensis TaxID=1197477 RepID=A0A084TKI4_9FLAO|nr:hypothetical protein [Mangrovimonas yunxiaonensis]KFB01220.1 hypothetical protein IA57_05150 [Mangrovimonas yunxiaonensis]GGH37979.1 hypothetical protein GCM10011364_06380 [Mangrovimonas yunxiaonensis]